MQTLIACVVLSNRQMCYLNLLRNSGKLSLARERPPSYQLLGFALPGSISINFKVPSFEKSLIWSGVIWVVACQCSIYNCSSDIFFCVTIFACWDIENSFAGNFNKPYMKKLKIILYKYV